MRKVLYILYQPYKWLFFFPFLFINTIFFGIVAVLVSSLVNQRVGSYWGGVVWSRLNSWLTPMFVKVIGRENVDSTKSYIIVSNHLSYYDIFLVYGWLGIDIKWLMKKELKKLPGIGFGSKKVGHIFIDRSNAKKAFESLNEAKRRLVDGTSVVIFPEGTRSKDGELGEFKRGAFKIAFDLGLPILPITIKGTNRILPANSIDLFPGSASLTIHKPIDINLYASNELERLVNDVRLKYRLK